MIYADKKGFYVFGENDDEYRRLREVEGGHKTGITAIKYDNHLSLVATGSEKGEVGVWDFELSQLLGICLAHEENSEITAIEFMSPYPVMVTAAQDARVCIWRVRPAP